MKFTTIKIEGEILSPEIIEKINGGDVDGQSSADFGFDKKVSVKDEILSTWAEASTLWKTYRHRMDRVPEDDTGTSVTRNVFAIPFFSLMGYDLEPSTKEEINGKSYAISHRAKGHDLLPVMIMGFRDSLDRKRADGGPRMSPHGLVQEYLNLTEHLYGIITNGLQIRILRDSSRLIRQSYLEFDLERIFDGEQFADFAVLYRLMHASRFPLKKETSSQCIFEKYHQDAIDSGARIREGLSLAMERSIKLLGEGFLASPENDELREYVSAGHEKEVNFYRWLLRILYRWLFLMVIEERNLVFGDRASEGNRRIYFEYYSINRIRKLSEKKHSFQEKYTDIWFSILNTFELFGEENRGKVLGIEPLGGLFNRHETGILSRSSIDNKTILDCFELLNFFINSGTGQKMRVNYASLNVEEFGSVYEGMLDFHPHIRQSGGRFTFELAAGTERKTTGSYYTPEELVAELIKSALIPVVDERLGGIVSKRHDFSKIAPEEKKKYEDILLDMKVCDPACGSGHFLLGATRYMGKLLARLRTGEDEPSPEEFNRGKRDVISHCIYGVDKNPMAVELCKVALWLEGHSAGNPLSFIDHHVRCGDSLVGVMNIEDIKKNGIPNDAFKPVTGDFKDISSNLKKLNSKYDQDANYGSLFAEGPVDMTGLEEEFKKLNALRDDSIESLKIKEEHYRNIRSEGGLWSKTETLCNLWTAAFFTQHTQNNINNKCLTTNDEFFRFLNGEQIAASYTATANALASELRFFHWELEFPEVFAKGGFDSVLGNPPWERIKLQEKEFFASKDHDIANARNKAERESLINDLKKTNPGLLMLFEKEKYIAEATSRFLRESLRYKLTARGDINTYAVFTETARTVITGAGRFGIIVPTGIATDDTNKAFFEDLIKKNNLVSILDFENRKALFQSVHRSFKFSLLTAGFNKSGKALFSFFLTETSESDDKLRRFTLTPEEIALLNPNTMTCPVFRTSVDAELTKKIYKNVPVFINERTDENTWGISFVRMFDMSNDSHLFKDASGKGLLPLYEAKMFHQFDHRWATYTSGDDTRDVTVDEKTNPAFSVVSRYWVDEKDVKERVQEKWDKKWFLCFRDITNATNERTFIATCIPQSAVGNKAPVLLSNDVRISCLLACLSSFAFDFSARQKIGGTSMNYFIAKQLPVLPPEKYSQTDIDFIKPRVLELVYTAYDLKPFAVDMGYDGEPFPWDEERRALLRAELDAYYAKLYGLNRDELRYILDPQDIYGEDFPGETFRVLKENEIRKYGEYRTRRLVLEAWDRLWG